MSRVFFEQQQSEYLYGRRIQVLPLLVLLLQARFQGIAQALVQYDPTQRSQDTDSEDKDVLCISLVDCIVEMLILKQHFHNRIVLSMAPLHNTSTVRLPDQQSFTYHTAVCHVNLVWHAYLHNSMQN